MKLLHRWQVPSLSFPYILSTFTSAERLAAVQRRPFFVLFTSLSLSLFAQDRTNRTKHYAKLTSAVDFKANIHPPRDAHNTTCNPTRMLQLFNSNASQRYSKPRSSRHKQTRILQKDQSIKPPREEYQVFLFATRTRNIAQYQCSRDTI